MRLALPRRPGLPRTNQLQQPGATQDGATQDGSQQVSTGAQQLGSTQLSPQPPPRQLLRFFILPKRPENRPPRFLPKQPPLPQPLSQQPVTAGAQQDGAASQQAEAAGAQQEGAASQHAGAQQLGSAMQPQAEAAGAQQSGAAVQQAACGAQQVGSGQHVAAGAQQVGSGAQQLGAQSLPPQRPAEAKLALAHRAKAAVRVVHFMESSRSS